MSKQKYHIFLNETERRKIRRHLKCESNSMESRKHAQILLDLDESGRKKLAPIKVIAANRGVCPVTLWKVRKEYVEEGIDSVLQRKKRCRPPVPPIVTEEVLLRILAIADSTPPFGKRKWSMKMIADRLIADKVVLRISDETVRKVLKKIKKVK